MGRVDGEFAPDGCGRLSTERGARRGSRPPRGSPSSGRRHPIRPVLRQAADRRAGERPTAAHCGPRCPCHHVIVHATASRSTSSHRSAIASPSSAHPSISGLSASAAARTNDARQSGVIHHLLVGRRRSVHHRPDADERVRQDRRPGVGEKGRQPGSITGQCHPLVRCEEPSTKPRVTDLLPPPNGTRSRGRDLRRRRHSLHRSLDRLMGAGRWLHQPALGDFLAHASWGRAIRSERCTLASCGLIAPRTGQVLRVLVEVGDRPRSTGGIPARSNL